MNKIPTVTWLTTQSPILEAIEGTIMSYEEKMGYKPEVLRIHRYTYDLLKKEIAHSNGDTVTEFMGVRIEVVE